MQLETVAHLDQVTVADHPGKVLGDVRISEVKLSEARPYIGVVEDVLVSVGVKEPREDLNSLAWGRLIEAADLVG
jgi:hypothetical protein